MQFHLNYTPQESSLKINHKDRLFLIGSCFSENIGTYLNSHKFSVCSNPAGMLFNPASIAAALQWIMSDAPFDEKFLIERDGLFYSLLHHSSINGKTKDELLEKINLIHKDARGFLETASILVITFGSAYVYRHKQLNKTVANCHKLPGHVFEKKLLSVEQVYKNYSILVQQLQLFNPSLNIVFTVSPVKYLKDGIIENNLSKSVLLLSVHELTRRFSNCSYFPAYELVNDDLRDYRFYKSDMAHPNEQAIIYVWEKFSECFFTAETKNINQKINKLNLALQHKPLNNKSDEAKKLEEYISRLESEIKEILPGTF